MERQFKTAHDLGIWIEANIEDKNTYNEVMDAMYWFMATRAAEDMSEYSTKDIAELLLNGHVNIKGDLQYVYNLLDSWYNQGKDEDYTIEEINASIRQLLIDHFNI